MAQNIEAAAPVWKTSIIAATILGGILFIGGLNWRVFAALVAVLVAGFVTLILSSPYRLQRILGFMDPWADPYGKGYQLSHSLIARRPTLPVLRLQRQLFGGRLPSYTMVRISGLCSDQCQILL